MRRTGSFRWLAPLLALGFASQAAAQGAAKEAGASSSPAPQGRIVYQATPPPAYGTSGEPAPAMTAAPPPAETGGAPAAPAGPGVEIISGGGGGSPGAARVGRMPVLQ